MDVVKFIWDFFEGRGDIRHINNTFVTLISEVTGMVRINEFRPISCINTTYKILSKLLANRLSKVMSELLYCNLSAFTKGRNITDNILLVKEHLRGFGQKGTTRRVCIKLDITKAFDSASWKAIRLTLASLMFTPCFVNMILKCISTTSFSLLVEGEATDRFTSGRGLWQGDPLSPLIFNLLMENLSQGFHSVQRRGLLDTFKVAGV